jgi:hypothetical protein
MTPSLREEKATEKSKLYLGPKTDFTGWVKRLQCKVLVEQNKSDAKVHDKWDALRAEAERQKKSADNVPCPYKFPHRWLTFLTEEPVMPDGLNEYEKSKYELEYNHIVSIFGEWWAEYLPPTFVESLEKNLYDYKVHEIMEKLSVAFGNRSGVSLGTRILSTNDFSRAGFKKSQLWFSTLEQRYNQANALAVQLLGRELTWKDSLIAGALENFPPEVWAGKISFTNEGFTFEKLKEFIANTYPDKSSDEIRPDKKNKRGNELNVSHVRSAKKFKVKKKGEVKTDPSPSNTKTPFYGECRYCFYKGHQKKDCRLFHSEQAEKFFRTDDRTNPITKERGSEPVMWKKVDGKIVVTHIKREKDKKVSEYESESDDGFPTPLASPYVERYLSPTDNNEQRVIVTHVESEVLSEDEPLTSKVKDKKSKIPKVISHHVSMTNVLEEIAKLSEEAKVIGKAIDEAVSSSIPDILRTEPLSSDHWVLDGGCGGHLTGNPDIVLSKRKKSDVVYNFGNKNKLRLTHIGHSILWFKSPGLIKSFKFKNVAYVPGVSANILSENLLKLEGYKVTDSLCGMHKYVFDNNNYLQFVASAINGTYYMSNIIL